MSKTAYLSGPMRGFPQWNFPAFDRNAAFLRDNGWKIISPAEVDREIGFDETDETAVFTEADFEVAIRRDYVALTEADAIIFMPGWEKSTGAKLESTFADALKLDRYRVDADKSYLEKELVIGLAGVARVGKNTIAQEFVDNAGFEQAGFADSLKNMLYALNPRLPDPNWEEVGDSFGHDGTVKVRDYVDKFGWEGAKSNPAIRQSLQILGTEAGRDVLGENIWIQTLFTKPHSARLVISDVRYFNEASAIKERGGYVIRINRPGIAATNSHISEKLDFESDYEIMNDRTPKETYISIVDYLSSQGIEL